MADASVLKTDGGNPVRVRVPSPAPTSERLKTPQSRLKGSGLWHLMAPDSAYRQVFTAVCRHLPRGGSCVARKSFPTEAACRRRRQVEGRQASTWVQVAPVGGDPQAGQRRREPGNRSARRSPHASRVQRSDESVVCLSAFLQCFHAILAVSLHVKT